MTLLIRVPNDSGDNASALVHEREKVSFPYSHKFLTAVHSFALKKPRQTRGSEVECLESESSGFSSTEVDLFINPRKLCINLCIYVHAYLYSSTYLQVTLSFLQYTDSTTQIGLLNSYV